ncbi:MAG: Uncharacterised protein [Owenweeksia sp. TMED14]|nr:MAG: Uncharacterised protein [Owenweeksia sp. TMED14]|tara:strand:+ start:4198 stop:4797 length:600 start_codon:yes stop_codon:yes gene_type:complete
MTADWAIKLFRKAINDYHQLDKLEPACPRISTEDNLSKIFFQKAWIDIVQWHLEDEIRREDLPPIDFISLKRRIDTLNQRRTGIVEKMDAILKELLQPDENSDGSIRTESLGWAMDRLSILQLKIYHMDIESARQNSNFDLVKEAKSRLRKLELQNKNLIDSINELISDLKSGDVKYNIFEQHKLYNDPDTNPALYGVE